ncbi:hypothetical protein C8J56DRAFT_1055280 [Mycena floridula]|nr:hypothetical protein C8J56DRAFT_1055280 [Mycena floridula]
MFNKVSALSFAVAALHVSSTVAMPFPNELVARTDLEARGKLSLVKDVVSLGTTIADTVKPHHHKKQKRDLEARGKLSLFKDVVSLGTTIADTVKPHHHKKQKRDFEAQDLEARGKLSLFKDVVSLGTTIADTVKPHHHKKQKRELSDDLEIRSAEDLSLEARKLPLKSILKGVEKVEKVLNIGNTAQNTYQQAKQQKRDLSDDLKIRSAEDLSLEARKLPLKSIFKGVEKVEKVLNIGNTAQNTYQQAKQQKRDLSDDLEIRSAEDISLEARKLPLKGIFKGVEKVFNIGSTAQNTYQQTKQQKRDLSDDLGTLAARGYELEEMD